MKEVLMEPNGLVLRETINSGAKNMTSNFDQESCASFDGEVG